MSDGLPGQGPEPVRQGANYTQVNIMFPASEVELPPADKYKAFPPEAQKAILLAFQREQMERHSWLKNQQRNDHVLNTNAQRFAFVAQLAGTTGGVIIVIAMIICGTALLFKGVSAAGVSMIIAAIGGLVGTAVYGHHKTKPPEKSSKPESREVQTRTP